MSHHHIGHFRNGGILCQHASNILTVTKHSHPVGQRFHFMHFMGNNYNSLAGISHFPENVKELLCLLRCQYSGRLIQDQDIRTTIQHLYNLHGLLLGYRHIIDFLLRIYFKTVFVTDLLYFTGCLLDIKPAFQTQDDILGSGKYIDQLKMLMHHTDSQP